MPPKATEYQQARQSLVVIKISPHQRRKSEKVRSLAREMLAEGRGMAASVARPRLAFPIHLDISFTSREKERERERKKEREPEE